MVPVCGEVRRLVAPPTRFVVTWVCPHCCAGWESRPLSVDAVCAQCGRKAIRRGCYGVIPL